MSTATATAPESLTVTKTDPLTQILTPTITPVVPPVVTPTLTVTKPTTETEEPDEEPDEEQEEEQETPALQGINSLSTEKAGLAEINAQYNPALSLAENMAILRGAKAKEEDAVDSAIYYGGGMIQNTDMTDEINRLLRGY